MQKPYDALFSSPFDHISIPDGNIVVGSLITTVSGVTVIPVSRVSVTTLGANAKSDRKRDTDLAGDGALSHVTVSPVAFLCVSKEGDARLISVKEKEKQNSTVDRIASLIERAPQILHRIREVFSGSADE